MANLAAYADCSVLLDKSLATPAIVVADTSSYPAGINIYLTGKVTVKQPDGVTVTGTFADITWNGSALTTNSKTLRLATDGNFQNGVYIVTYVVRVTGYDDTTVVKTFTLDYTAKSISITDLTDVFTPSLQVIDGTNYGQIGFGTPSVTRAWTGNIKYVGSGIQTVTGTTALFDMAYSAAYYDAFYDISLVATSTLVGLNTITYLTVKDKLQASFQVDAYTPPTLATLVTDLANLKVAIEAGTHCGCGCGDVDYTDYTKATAIYENIVTRGLNGETTSPDRLDTYVDQIQKIINCSGTISRTHTGVAIPAYNFGNTGSSSVHVPIQFTVDSGGTYAPAAATQAYNNPTIAGNNKYSIYRQAQADYLVEGVDFSYNAGGGFTLTASTFVSGERFTLVFYA